MASTASRRSECFEALDVALCRVQQGRVPQSPASPMPARLDQINQPAFINPQAHLLRKVARSREPALSRMNVFRMGSQAYEIALSSALRSIGSAALSASRAMETSFWNLLLGTLSFRKLRPQSRQSRGPITPDQYYERNVVVPGGYSKRFFCVPIGLYRGKCRNARARGTPPRSARGGPCGTRPAACASRVTSSLWCWPISRISVPPGASRLAA